MPSTRRPRDRATAPLLLALLVAALAPAPGAGQGVVPGVAGAGAGLAVGGAMAVGYLTARAHFADDLLDGYHDLVPVPVALVSAGLVSGIGLGTTDSRRLGRASLAALLVGAGGVGMGILAGRAFMEPETGPWAGALLGGATGALVGWILGATLGGDDGAPAQVEIRIPIGIGGGR